MTAEVKKSEDKETTLNEALNKINDIYIDVEKQKNAKKESLNHKFKLSEIDGIEGKESCDLYEEKFLGLTFKDIGEKGVDWACEEIIKNEEIFKR